MNIELKLIQLQQQIDKHYDALEGIAKLWMQQADCNVKLADRLEGVSLELSQLQQGEK